MSTMDKRDTDYTRARADLMKEMLDRNLFDASEHDRGEAVARIVERLQDRYPELDEQMTRRLVGEGMQRSWSEARTNEMATEGTEREEPGREEPVREEPSRE